MIKDTTVYLPTSFSGLIVFKRRDSAIFCSLDTMEECEIFDQLISVVPLRKLFGHFK